MANTLKDKPPILSQTEPLMHLRNMQGLSLVLGRVSHSDTIQNSSESINNFKNSMVYAKLLTWGDINRVAPVQPGERKFASSDDRPTAYRPDDVPIVEQQSGKSTVLGNDGSVYLILGNSHLNWCENLYNQENFAKGLPSAGPGIRTSPTGWVYARIYKAFDGVNDEAGTNWFPVTNYMDYWKELKELNFKGDKAQATRICGSANEQTTGTCCLYYKENYYDSVAGVTWSAGDYYKCVCAKCYHCLEMARSLDMGYVFTKFAGNGPTGGTGENCLDCGLDNYPSNCGPCPCTIGTYDKFDVLLNDPSLPEHGLAKTNARIGANWNRDLVGTVLVHCNLDMVDYTKLEISTAYWGKDKLLEFVGPQAPGKTTKTVCRFTTETRGDGKEYMTGLTLVTTGQYTAMPAFPEEELIKMVPGIDATKFRMVMLPDMSQLSEVCEVVGPTRTQISTTIRLADIERKTNISNFNVYALAVPKTTNGEPYFDSKTNLSTSSRLTYRHKGVNKTVDMSSITSQAEAEIQEKGKKNTQISTTNTGNAIIANSKVVNPTKVDLEMYAGNTVDFTTGFEYVDSAGDTWAASSDGWLKPTSLQSKLELDAQETDVLHVNGFSLNIPGGTSIPGLNSHTVRLTLTI